MLWQSQACCPDVFGFGLRSEHLTEAWFLGLSSHVIAIIGNNVTKNIHVASIYSWEMHFNRSSECLPGRGETPVQLATRMGHVEVVKA